MYDSIIIGGGTAGVTCAIYLARANKKVLLIEKEVIGGQILTALHIDNYPTQYGISGIEYSEKLKKDLSHFDIDIINDEVIELIDTNHIKTKNNIYETKTIVIATGLKKRELNVPNIEKYKGAGISYCSTCDGAFFKGKNVCIVGSGNTAVDDACYLSSIANKVYVLNRSDKFKAFESNTKDMLKKDNIEVLYNVNISSFKGENKIEGVILDNKQELDVDGVFIAIGGIPDKILFKEYVDIDNLGYIISEDTTTKTPNIFVIGDIRTKSLRQLVTAASDGAIASSKIINYLIEKN